jgi:hypothetical protein
VTGGKRYRGPDDRPPSDRTPRRWRRERPMNHAAHR